MSRRWKISAQVYQNTIEQAVLFVCTLLPLAAVVPATQAKILPVLVVVWFFGRVCYLVSYRIEPAYRAFGFDYTLFPSLTAGGWFLATVLGG